MRAWATVETQRVLTEFQGLDRLRKLSEIPRRSVASNECEAEAFADLLESIYESTQRIEDPCREQLRRVRPFEIEELLLALMSMSNNRCADEAGIVLEMLKYGSSELEI